MENAQDLRTLHLGTHNCRGNALRAGLVGPISKGSSQTAPLSDPRACELCEIRIPPKYQAASCADNTFLLTRAVHCTAWTASPTGLQVLRSHLGCGDLGSKLVKRLKQLGRRVLGPGPYHSNFNSGDHVIGKTRVAPNTSKTGTAWWVASNQESYILHCTTQYKAAVPWDDFKWSLVAVPNMQFLRSLLSCRDLVSHGPNA